MRRCNFLCGLALAVSLAVPTAVLGLDQGDNEQNAARLTQELAITEEAAPESAFAEVRLADHLQQSLKGLTSRDPAVSREARRIWKNVARFYESRGYHPAWGDNDGGFALAPDLFAKVREAADHALDPGHYNVDELETAVAEGKNAGPGRWMELDVHLTHLFMTYAKHLAHGRLDPRDIDTDWYHAQRYMDFAQILEEALAYGRIGDSLDAVIPKHRGYRELEQAYRDLRASMETVWPAVNGSYVVKLGEREEGLDAVRSFLRVMGDLPAGPDIDPQLMDPQLEEAVYAFQVRHGIEADGVVGPETLGQMQVTLHERLRTMQINLERHRWLGDVIGDRAVVVNIPEYRLRVIEDGDVLYRMKAITGTDSTQTPAFADEIEHIEINPNWHVPRSIATGEIVPKILEDPGYLASQKISVFDPEGVLVDPDSIAWASLEPGTMGYRFRQAPGSRNPLGSIKFLFPNRFSVYLHDTNNTPAFNGYRRALSHGCIRIEQPLSLAAFLLQDDLNWTGFEIAARVKSGKRRWIDLSTTMPIYVVYFTAFVEDGRISFRRDIYGRDEMLDVALAIYESPGLTVDRYVAEISSQMN